VIFKAEEERAVRALLAELERPVELALVLGPAEATTLAGAREIDPEAESRKILEGIAELSELVSVSEHGEGAFGVDRHPAVVVLAGGDGGSTEPQGQRETRMRFYGTPWGYELTSLVGAVLEAGKAESSLAPASLEALASLERDVSLEVFVTPT
jgi:alkyl hydroperoxide reductase subunit AhpF